MKRIAVVPAHPVRWIVLERIGVPLQLGEVDERIDATEFGGVDQAHEQVADFCTILGASVDRTRKVSITWRDGHAGLPKGHSATECENFWFKL